MSRTSVQMLSKDTAGASITLPFSGASVISSNVPADSYYGFSDGIHTIAVSLDSYTGSIAIEGTLAKTPGANDWFRIPLSGQNAVAHTTSTGTSAYTFTGNYLYVRALVFGRTAGSVTTILLNH